jgi:branched-chain amino acid transport system permease protein
LPENGRSARGVTTGFDLNWVAAMIFMVIIGAIGTLEGPILGAVIYYGIRELLTSAFAPSGSWYLITLSGPLFAVASASSR